ncbi:MAG: DUF1553 domain-containing protein [Gemmatales bacterium]
MKRSSLTWFFLCSGIFALSFVSAWGDDTKAPPAKAKAEKAAPQDDPAKKNTDKKADDKKDDDKASVSGLNDARTIAFINEQIEAAWKENKIQPSALANDYEWIRRIFIDTIGRIPSVIPARVNPKDDPIGAKGELNHFLELPASRRRTEVVRYLLNHEDYARNWANIWTIWLITRTTQPGINRPNLQTWLERQLGENRRYDEIVQELLTATATDKDGCASKVDKTAAPANFLLSHFGEIVPPERRMRDGQFEMIPATSRVTRVFLGIQTQCTQCHDHPFIDDRKQGQFWGVNVFLRQMEREPATINVQNARMQSLQHYKLRDNTNANPEAGIFYEQRNGLLKRSSAVWLDKSRPSLSSNTPRRSELARYLINDEYFAKSFVNRIWAHYMGRGFTNPVDDFGEHNPVSHPDLLNRLAQDFVTSGYDVHRLITWIVSSKPYQLTSVANATNNKPDAEPYFARMQLKTMAPEVLVESIFTATNFLQIKHPASSDNFAQKRRDTTAEWLRDFTVNFGDDEGNEASFNGTVVQALLLMNGQKMNEAVNISQIAKMAMDSSRPLDLLYLAVLNRPPTAKERETFALATHPSNGYAQVYMKPAERNKLYRDVLWALFNSNEFMLNH